MGANATKEFSALKHCTLWKSDLSPACRAVMMTIDALNLNIQEVDLNMDKGDHKSAILTSLNKRQTLPVLKYYDLVLHESNAISKYLVTQFRDDGSLLPKHNGYRYICDQMLHYNSGVLYPNYIAAASPILKDGIPYIIPSHVSNIEDSYGEMELFLSDRCWFSNLQRPMLCDVCISATVSTLNVMVPIDKERYPRLADWLRRISQEVFYLTGNKKGLDEFVKRLDCGYIYDDFDEIVELKKKETSEKRRIVTNQPIKPA